MSGYSSRAGWVGPWLVELSVTWRTEEVCPPKAQVRPRRQESQQPPGTVRRGRPQEAWKEGLALGGSRQKCLLPAGVLRVPCDFLVPFCVALENCLKGFSGISNKNQLMSRRMGCLARSKDPYRLRGNFSVYPFGVTQAISRSWIKVIWQS